MPNVWFGQHDEKVQGGYRDQHIADFPGFARPFGSVVRRCCLGRQDVRKCNQHNAGNQWNENVDQRHRGSVAVKLRNFNSSERKEQHENNEPD